MIARRAGDGVALPVALPVPVRRPMLVILLGRLSRVFLGRVVVVIAVDGATIDPADYSVSRPGGEVTFDTPPPNGDPVTAGYLFDCEVRFESDDAFEGILRDFQIGGFADITLIEVRPC